MVDQNREYLTLKDAARLLGLKYFKVQRAAKRGLFPTYRLLNTRPLVRLEEIVAAIESSKQMGGK